MSNQPTRRCPRCGTLVTRSGGLSREEAGEIAHKTLHCLPHTGPIAIFAGFGAVATAVLTPKSYVCGHCRHEFRD